LVLKANSNSIYSNIDDVNWEKLVYYYPGIYAIGRDFENLIFDIFELYFTNLVVLVLECHHQNSIRA